MWSHCLPTDHPLKEHDYCKGQVDLQSMNIEQSIVNELLELHCRVKELEEENENLRSKCLLLEQVRLDDRKFQFWTEFPNYETFMALLNYLEGVGAIGRMRHWRGSEMLSKDPFPKKAARIAKLTPEEELFMVLVRLRVGLFDLRFQQIIHTVSFRCLTFISPDLKRFQHETSTTLAATTNSSSHENTLFQRAHARFPLARGGYNNSRQCQSHFRSPTETPVSGLLLETNNKTIKLKCSAFDKD